ncbi:MAG: toll/interleukin-1 receptor domain-containing protein [Gammaproteobacteria bacterium]|nr:toll/interleukin-1 receptor domain-containing protein [Gammaproteobacteria bacterium]
MNAFISHASKDVALAARLEELLEEDGLKVWLDHSEIRLGVLLRKELQTAIKNSRVLILLWSKVAAKSRWIAAEVLTAFHLNRFIAEALGSDPGGPSAHRSIDRAGRTLFLRGALRQPERLFGTERSGQHPDL